jgi:hypothetical protein
MLLIKARRGGRSPEDIDRTINNCNVCKHPMFNIFQCLGYQGSCHFGLTSSSGAVDCSFPTGYSGVNSKYGLSQPSFTSTLLFRLAPITLLTSNTAFTPYFCLSVLFFGYFSSVIISTHYHGPCFGFRNEPRSFGITQQS